ncbi:MAG: hypothetical protein IKV30_07275 [Clostridia bacterium]|nr:hypothetical protein [Clostridia bacterium]
MKDKLLFKQPVHQGQKEMMLAFLILAGFCFFITMIACVIWGNKGLAFLFFPIYQLVFSVFYWILECERFEIYEDKIIVRNALRTKNIVLLENVKFVEEGKLNLAGKGEGLVDYYILNDGRKNKRPGWPHRNEFLNKKKYNFRIYKTEELEAFLKERFEIRQKDFLYEE